MNENITRQQINKQNTIEILRGTKKSNYTQLFIIDKCFVIILFIIVIDDDMFLFLYHQAIIDREKQIIFIILLRAAH